MSPASWCWLALVAERPAGARAVAAVGELDGAPAGWLAAWDADAAPHPGTRLGADPGPGPDPGLRLGADPGPGPDPGLRLGADPGPDPDPGLRLGADPGPDPGRWLRSGADADVAPDPGPRRRSALRVSRQIIDPAGPAGLVSLVLPPIGVRLAFDDPAVQQARRAVLAGRPSAAVSTLLWGDSQFEGAVTVWPQAALSPARDDPFARIFPARLLRLGAGLIGPCPPPCGPTIERYGSANPWPWDRFGG